MSMENATAWESEIRAREEALRTAFLAADIPALEDILAEGYIVNSPLQKVIDRPLLLELLRTGRIGHLSFQIEIERIERYGDVVVVMGHDRVTDLPDGAPSTRRFTNIWQQAPGTWRSIARHAHVLAEAAYLQKR